MKTQIQFSNNEVFSIDEFEKSLFLNEKIETSDVRPLGHDKFLLLRNNQAFEIEILSRSEDEFRIKVNGLEIHIEVIDHQKQILKKLGMEVFEEELINEICSPMPGTIIEISCKKGESVKKGDTLLILEAMKMENSIKSPASGTITEVMVKVGMNVEKNQCLVVF